MFVFCCMYCSSYFEWFSSSLDNICSLTLSAFFESFWRIAAQIRPVTVTNIYCHWHGNRLMKTLNFYLIQCQLNIIYQASKNSDWSIIKHIQRWFLLLSQNISASFFLLANIVHSKRSEIRSSVSSSSISSFFPAKLKQFKNKYMKQTKM